MTKKQVTPSIETLRLKSEEQYRLLFEYAVEAIIVIQDSRIKICNPMSELVTGYNRDELLALPFSSLVFPEDLPGGIDFHDKRLIGENQNLKYQFRILRKDGEIRWVESGGILINWNDEPATLNFVIDITERKAAEDALKKSEEMYRLLTEYASDVIWIFNLDQAKFTYISPAVLQLRGYTAEEAMMQSLADSLVPEYVEAVNAAIRKFLQEFLSNPIEPKVYYNEIRQPCKDGRIIWVEVSTKFRYNEFGEIDIVGVSRNIENRKKAEEQILYLSYFDQLTGLYNRRFYEEELKRLDTIRNLPITLVMADVNGLKLTNDAFGHVVGDKLLKEVAHFLKKMSRSDDIVARTGGDEFVILLPKTTSSEAEIVVNRLQEAISAATVDEVVVSVSFGWATKKEIHETLETIFTKAEDFMYRRKLFESSNMKSETIKLIIKTLFEKDWREQRHCENVSEYCKKTGQAMGLNKKEIDELGVLGRFHDIGKIGISEELLTKPEPLEAHEWREIKKHSETGYQILKSVNEFAYIAEFVLSHHERVDGTGYPRGLIGDRIPLQSKILSVAEAYDSMVHDHLYKKEISKEEAIKLLIENVGTQFDERVVSIFIDKVIGK